jgi:hypothetical protein
MSPLHAESLLRPREAQFWLILHAEERDVKICFDGFVIYRFLPRFETSVGSVSHLLENDLNLRLASCIHHTQSYYALTQRDSVLCGAENPRERAALSFPRVVCLMVG